MSYGNDTPITSSDEEDDAPRQQQHAQPMGNFTETNYHAQVPAHHPSQRQQQSGTPLTDDDDDDDMNMHSNNAINTNNNNEENWLIIHYEGNESKFSFQADETFKDLRDRINAREDMKMSECHFFIIPRHEEDEEDEYEEEETEEELRARGGLIDDDENTKLLAYHGQLLSVYWMSFDLHIMDGMELDLMIRVSQDWQIKKVKDEIEKNHSVKLQCLSYKGMELIDDQTLAYYAINKTGYTLISRILVSIEDHQCEIATDLLICDFWDFEMVLTTYLDKERRERHKSAKLYYEGHEVQFSESVYNYQLENRSKIEYKVDAYPINIYDSEAALNQSQQMQQQQQSGGGDLNAYTLLVFDQWTLNDVKKSYSKLTKKPFMEKEKFLSQERELEDNVPLWKLRIRDNEKLIIEREQQEVIVTYICCECGAAVKLRRYDSVQCRQCFHGAVYKQRTARVCQYSCR